MIEIHATTMRFGRTRAVDNVTLSVPEGSSLALWGANGAGKTSLIRCVLGLLRFEGSIRVAGLDVRRQGKRARLLIGYVPQELGFYDDLGVGEAIDLFSRLKGLGRPAIAPALAGVGLEGQHAKRVRELSGGMKQRLALAIALLGEPPVLVLDEVTASLDALGRDEFVSLLGRLRGAGRTIARINNPKNELLFKKRGIETTISATTAILAQIEQELPTHDMIALLQLHSGLELFEIRLPETSPAVGRSVREVLLPPESLISLIVDPGGVPRIPSGDTRLHAGDALVVATRKENRDMLREALIGSTHGMDT
ncbi:MAG: ATP-binding cassette domain-containing protein [Dehalococcoidia bacterium]|nr:ATP-binding cassette domain-containing protein [Dehalococcoidia bacterium]